MLVAVGLGWRLMGGSSGGGSTQVRQKGETRADRWRRAAAQRARLRQRLLRAHGAPGQVRLLQGRVTSTNGDPVVAAVVRVLLPGGVQLKARSGADGRYALVGVPTLAPRMEVWARGYETRVFSPLKLPAGPRARFDVVLRPVAGVHGLVLVGREPVPDAIVMLRRTGERRVLGRARTDLGGRFALPLDDGAAGSYVISAFHPQHGKVEKTISGPVEVTLELPGGGYVEGTVVDDRGLGVRSFSLSSSSMARVGRGPVTRSFSGSNGHFRLGPLAPGRQVLYVIAPGYQPSRSRVVQVTSGQTLRGVEIRVARSGELTGLVTDADTGLPVARALVSPAEWGSRTLGRSAGVFTDAHGRYRLRTVPDSRTSLRVVARGYQPLLAGGVECGGGERCTRNFELTPVPQGERPGGQLTGVGAVLRKAPEGVRIQKLLAGGPADGLLQEGDLVVMVGDLDASTAGLKEVAQAIRGEVGTDVVLWVRRAGESEPRRIVITRERVSLPGGHHRRR